MSKTKIGSLIEDFKKAKKKILTLYSPKPEDSLAEAYDQAALAIAERYYGDPIDSAIDQLANSDQICPSLSAQFDILLRNQPETHGLGEGRMQKYHSRFVKRIQPILKKTPVKTF